MSHDAELLRACLRGSCGSCLQGWRRFFDPLGYGRVARPAFVGGCRRAGFAGDAEALFGALAGAAGLVEFDAVDREAAELLNDFAGFVQQEFGEVRAAFQPCVPRNHRKDNGCKVTFKSFMHACLEMGYDSENFRRLFDCLDLHCVGEVSLDQLAFLEHWKVGSAGAPSRGPAPGEALRALLSACAPLADVVAEAREESLSGELLAADVDAALLQAAERGSEGELRELLTLRADPNFCDASGVSVLHRASERASERVDATLMVQLLCASGAEVNVRARAGATPLHAAVVAGRPLTVASLLYLGADVHSRDAKSRSPLDLAVMRGDADCTRHLLGSFADPCCCGSGSRSAIELAEQHRQHEILGLLREQAGARTLELLSQALDRLLDQSLGRAATVRKAESMVSRYLVQARTEPERVAEVLWTWRETLPDVGALQGTIDQLTVSCLQLCADRQASIRDIAPAHSSQGCSWRQQPPRLAARRASSATRLRLAA